MKRRQLVWAALALVAATPGWAIDYVDGVVADLRAAGYAEITVSTTFLGRARIVADSPIYTREVIVDPRTGEILRDYRQAVGANEGGDTSGAGQSAGAGGGSGSSGSGASGSDDSGSGSGGSGSGGSGSGGSGSGGSGSGGSGHGGSGAGGDDD